MSESQIPVNTPQQYPGINNEADYTENLLVGYRWYDAKHQTPLFPFGHGLSYPFTPIISSYFPWHNSYTTFDYSGLSVSGNLKQGGITVEFAVKNSGQVDGEEVAQMYVGYPEAANEPPKALKAFRKVWIKLLWIRRKTFSVHSETIEVDFCIENK